MNTPNGTWLEQLVAGPRLAELAEAQRERQDPRGVLAAVDAANGGSIRMHERLGFARGAILREVGWKFGRWLDVEFMQKFLDAPGAPR